MKHCLVFLALGAFSIVLSTAKAEARGGARGPYGPTAGRSRPTGANGRPTPVIYRPNGPVANPPRQPQRSVRPIDRTPLPPTMRQRGIFGENESPNLVSEIARPFFNDQLNRAGRNQGQPPIGGRFGRAAAEGESDGILEAVEDIAESWKRGDPARLQSRFAKEGQVLIFEGEQFRQRTPAAELSRQVGEGVRTLKTVSFTLDQPKKLDHDRYFVSGKHRFAVQDEQPQQMYVSYVLEQRRDRWQIVEYGVSNSPIIRHSAVPAQEEEFGPMSGGVP